jgi:hypothetical protein
VERRLGRFLEERVEGQTTETRLLVRKREVRRTMQQAEKR